MSKHEVLDPDRPGRRSKIRRLIYQPSAPTSDRPGGGGRWRDERSWSAIKQQLRLTVRRAPEVVINVKGSRRSTDNERAAVSGVLRYMMYISRNGSLTAFNEQGEAVLGRDAVKDLHARWNLDLQRTRGAKKERLHPSFNIIFSMPARTDPDQLRDAVAAVAREHFQGHKYLLALHTADTDPADNSPAHPHVHLILRAEDESGRRIHIRKTHLRLWREQFAAQLRLRGIEANATSRAERGHTRKGVRSAEWHLQKRYEQSVKEGRPGTPPKVKVARFVAAARELQNGATGQKPWEQAMAARRRDVMRTLHENLARLREEGDAALAAEVQRFIDDMPSLDSERRAIQGALVEQVRARAQEQGKERDDDTA